jgi:hypothetical protein
MGGRDNIGQFGLPCFFGQIYEKERKICVEQNQQKNVGAIN